MSVDTYLKGKNTSRYSVHEHAGVKILVAGTLIRWAKDIHVDAKRFLLWRSFDVLVESKHVHGPT